MKISVVLPVYNEEKNLDILYKEIKDTFSKINKEHEIIFINDRSRDGSLDILRKIAKSDSNVKLISFKYNAGQTAAMSAGIKSATGDVIIPMDSDLQNDPADIPLFLAKIDDGYDVVSGWRKNRKDFLINRKIPSKIANWLIGVITGVRIYDYGC
jgi:glycosyltransferase involved in cell wall biosynthesis